MSNRTGAEHEARRKLFLRMTLSHLYSTPTRKGCASRRSCGSRARQTATWRPEATILRIAHWWSRTGSNRRHPACKAGALPAELRPLIVVPDMVIKEMVGLGGLEPPTSRLSSARSNQLSYKPLAPSADGSRHRGRASQGRPAVAARAAPSRSASSQRLRHGARAQSKSHSLKKEKRRRQTRLRYARR